MPAVTLSISDVKIAGHAINWLLNVPFYRIVPPHLTDHDRRNLTLTSDAFIEILSRDIPSVHLELSDELRLLGGHLFIPKRHYSLVRMAVNAFAEENQAAPTEVEIVTGLPSAQLVDLVERLEGMPTKR